MQLDMSRIHSLGRYPVGPPHRSLHYVFTLGCILSSWIRAVRLDPCLGHGNACIVLAPLHQSTSLVTSSDSSTMSCDSRRARRRPVTSIRLANLWEKWPYSCLRKKSISCLCSSGCRTRQLACGSCSNCRRIHSKVGLLKHSQILVFGVRLNALISWFLRVTLAPPVCLFVYSFTYALQFSASSLQPSDQKQFSWGTIAY